MDRRTRTSRVIASFDVFRRGYLAATGLQAWLPDKSEIAQDGERHLFFAVSLPAAA